MITVSVLSANAAGLVCDSATRIVSGAVPPETLTRLLNTTQFYQRLGRLAAGDPMPFVGTVAFAAGPGDSVIAVLGLSLENRSFAFQREGNSFVARYRVGLSFKRDGSPPVDLAREELVRVATFQETQRADESVLFQQVLRLVPGNYKVTVTVRDASSTAESSATSEYTAPKYGGATYSAPVLTYQQIAGLDDEELRAAVAQVNVYARIPPEGKLRLVRALEANGEVVAVTGDGVREQPVPLGAVLELRRLQPLGDQRFGGAERIQHVEGRRMEGRGARFLAQRGTRLQHRHRNAATHQHRSGDEPDRARPDDDQVVLVWSRHPYSSSRIRAGSSTPALTCRRKVTASRPSTIRWS